MREILFRGKRFDNGDWIEGWVTSQFKKYTEGEFLTRIKSNVFGGGERLVDTETVGQYSGFIDINGKKIFEHDLCLCKRNINDRFDKTVFETKYDKLIGFYGENEWGGNTISADEFDMCEIVGNVFDNPELLEVEK